MTHPIRSMLTWSLLCVVFCREGKPAEAKRFQYQDVKPVAGKDIAGLRLRSKDSTAYAAFQFGPNTGDVMRLAFDCEKELGKHDTLLVTIPGHERYGEPVSLSGRRRSGAIEFDKLFVAAAFGDWKVDYEICLSVVTLCEKRKLDCDADILCRVLNTSTRKKCRFILRGSFLRPLHSHVDIDVVRLLDAPSLRVGWDHRSNPPHVRCRILMGDFKLLPESGFGPNAHLRVVEGKDAVKQHKRFRVKFSGTSADFTYKRVRKMKPGKFYRAEVELDLSPFFGVLKGQAKTALR